MTAFSPGKKRFGYVTERSLHLVPRLTISGVTPPLPDDFMERM